MDRRPARRLALAAPAAVAAALALATPAAAANHVVQVLASAEFQPKTVTIAVGDSVTWINDNTGTHDVRADDNSFSTPLADSFTFTHTFTEAGTKGYYCTVHGVPGVGMFGTVIVQGGDDGGGGGGGGGNDTPGVLRFSLASYSVGEGAGSATIVVQRTGGDDGAVSVGYAATGGTAVAGQDFTAVSGTLSWPAGNDSPKTFAVPITNDALVEGNETVLLALSNPGGGATIDPARQAATLTIQDNDGGPAPGPPAAPSNLVATASSSTEISLTWNDNATNETGFQVEARTVGSAFQQVATVGPSVTSAVVGALQPSTLYLFRVRAVGSAASSAFSNVADATTRGVVGTCAPGPETLCVNGGRFRAEVDWRIPDGTIGGGQAVPVPSAPDSGLFYFFNPANLEMLLKVLNACGLNDRYWVFFAATTNVEFSVVVTDTQTGATKGYLNPLNRPAPPVQDTGAFATCP
jgi:plastocyanin